MIGCWRVHGDVGKSMAHATIDDGLDLKSRNDEICISGDELKWKKKTKRQEKRRGSPKGTRCHEELRWEARSQKNWLVKNCTGKKFNVIIWCSLVWQKENENWFFFFLLVDMKKCECGFYLIVRVWTKGIKFETSLCW